MRSENWIFNLLARPTPLTARLNAAEHRVEQLERHERNQAGLTNLADADPTFAKSLTAKLVPDRPEPIAPEVVRRVVDGWRVK